MAQFAPSRPKVLAQVWPHARNARSHSRGKVVGSTNLSVAPQTLISQQIIQAQENERQRVARELHDEAGQTLTLLLLRLQQLEQACSLEEVVQHTHECRRLTRAVLDDIGHLVHELSPAVLDDLGLQQAIAYQVDQINAMHGVQVSYTTTRLNQHCALPHVLELAFYRVAQEALTNIIRHARAQHAWVNLTLHADEGMLTLTICDDGVGFDLDLAAARGDEAHGNGLGLLGMRERLVLVGGSLLIQSRPGLGTNLTARAPVGLLQ
jgi:two-component system sensor histidine kinase UhpB